MRKLHLAAEIFTKLGLHRLVAALRPRSTCGIPILAYHRIYDVPSDYPFDLGLISATAEVFEQQMRILKKDFIPITIKQLVDHINKEKALPRNAIMITFDDGFDDNYYNAYPILKKLDMPATFFVSTDFVESNEAIWFERLAYFFYRVEALSIYIKQLDLELTLTSSLLSRREAYGILVEAIKLVENSIRIEILNELYIEYGDPYNSISEEASKYSKPMTWNQLQQMADDGFDIGAHSVTHPVLSKLTMEELSFELNESKVRLEEKINTEVLSTAYPVGQSESVSGSVLDITSKANYQIAFNYIDGVTRISSIEKFSIKRLHVDLDMPISLFLSKISFPELFCE